MTLNIKDRMRKAIGEQLGDIENNTMQGKGYILAGVSPADLQKFQGFIESFGTEETDIERSYYLFCLEQAKVMLDQAYALRRVPGSELVPIIDEISQLIEVN